MTNRNSVNPLAQPLGEMPPEAITFGRTEAMQAVQQRLIRLAGANVPVLIQGESGTGKDIIARMIHAASPWKTGPWVKVNCPRHSRHAARKRTVRIRKRSFHRRLWNQAWPGRAGPPRNPFSGRDFRTRPGAPIQLLQLLQDGQFCRIGAQEDKKVEVRVVCATNRKLEQEVESGAFRADLFYRINVVNLHLPPLRETWRRHSGPGELLSRISQSQVQLPRPAALLGTYGSAAKVPLAGKHPRTGKFDQALRDPGQREVIASDLTPREPDFFNADLPLDGQISLKKLTRQAVRELSVK